MGKIVLLLCCISAALIAETVSASRSAEQPHVSAASQLDAGRYLVLATGCNHCHTANWTEMNGKIPQSKWLLGGIAPPNEAAPDLRTIAGAVSQEQFVSLFRTKQPPSQMPWDDVDNLSDQDLGAVYQFIRSLK
jgi:mono/diheme cytochrome c family protein